MKRGLIQTLVATLIVVVFSAVGGAIEAADLRVNIDISSHPFKGPADAPVTVVVFSDYL